MTSLHILVVEDHPSSNHVLSALLRKRGHVVTPALTARAAVEAATTKLFDLAIIDIGLDDDDGWHLLQELRQARLDLPALAVTGYGFESDKQKSRDAGFAAHLTKPLCMSAVETEIARLFPATLAASRP